MFSPRWRGDLGILPRPREASEVMPQTHSLASRLRRTRPPYSEWHSLVVAATGKSQGLLEYVLRVGGPVHLKCELVEGFTRIFAVFFGLRPRGRRVPVYRRRESSRALGHTHTNTHTNTQTHKHTPPPPPPPPPLHPPPPQLSKVWCLRITFCWKLCHRVSVTASCKGRDFGREPQTRSRHRRVRARGTSRSQRQTSSRLLRWRGGGGQY